MKKLSIALMLLLLTLSMQAAPLRPTTILVMDSAQALLPGVTIRFSETSLQPLTTSWDGRVVFVQKDNQELKMTLTASDRDTLYATLTAADAGQTVILRMSPRRYHKSEIMEDATVARSGKARGKAAASERVLYSKSAATRTYAKAVAEEEVEIMAFSADALPAPVLYETSVATAEETGIADESASVVLGYGAAVNNLPSAGKLTAGEVNDFAKWALWANLLDQTHKSFVGDWKIEARNRYTVQLTNQQGFPLCDRAVSLTDKQGNTLFQARTDNTGKAELWNGLYGNPAKGKLYIEAEGLRAEAKPFREGITTLQIDADCNTTDIADVFFIFDATGSMGDELRYLQAEMQDVIRRSQSAVEGLKIRTGALVYRDHADDYLTRISRLSDNIEETQHFISAQHAMGGGDYEEAVPEAIMAAVNAAGWSDEARARIAFLVLDAPCHQDTATIRLLHEQTLNAAAEGVRLVPVVCSGLQESGELLMRSLALATNGTSFFLTDHSGIGDTHLKPTTDSLKVEHLNDMLVRTIISFTRIPECNVEEWAEEALAPEDTDDFLPAPFTAEDLDSVPAVLPEMPLAEVLKVHPNPCTDYFLADLPLGCEALFLADMTGKTIESLGAQEANTFGKQINVSRLASGVYFLKAWYGGRWYTQKVIVK